MFEATYKTIEKRAPDIFMAGYGAMWTPPPGRADSGNSSVGYDVYDRFDLGRANSSTLYGSELGLKQTVKTMHRAASAVYTDLIWNHNGFSNLGTPGFNAAGGYPGFSIQLQTTNPANPGYNTRGYNDVDGDFHGAFEGGDLNGRLSGLIDVAQEKNWQFVRHPVPGVANNIPAGTTPAFGRLANVPTESNRRFYPDRDLPGQTYFDPANNQNYTVYPFNTSNPMAGDPVEENATGLLMRQAQWMVQEIGVDGFRLDAVKHLPTWAWGYFDRAVYDSIQKPLLDGSKQHVYSFGEIFDGNKAFIQTYIKKNLNTGTAGMVRGNRDALDFPLFFSLGTNLSSSGTTNDWRNVVNASQDSQDDGLASNGSQGMAFVQSHDSFGPYLNTVAHAYSLMRPGNAVVYFNAKEFGNGRAFPKDGRTDALGGFYGQSVTTLVNIRNTHGRGNYSQRVLTKEALIYERLDSAIVALSNRMDNGSDLFSAVQTSFAPDQRLIELTGNSSDLTVDPTNNISEILVVDPTGKVDVRIPRNKNASGVEHGRGYVIYGLPTPQGTLSLTNVASTIAAETPTAATNGTARLTALDVVTANSFQVKLATIPVLVGGWHDVNADGDTAVIRMNEGLDLNGSGSVDFRAAGDISYGFENFLTKSSPLFTGGDGEYIQNIDATQLPEGQNFITARAYRHSDVAGTPVFQDFRKAIYVDRLKPVSAVNDFAGVGSSAATTRDLTLRSTDLTADKINVFLDLPANLSDAQVLALVGGTNSTGQIDRDLFTYRYSNVGNGNHVVTIVSTEISGNQNVQRIVGQYTNTTRGAGLGDTNFDGTYAANDVSGLSTAMEVLVYPNGSNQNNTQFNAAADLNADGLMDSRDLYGVRDRFRSIGAPPAAITAAENAVRRRGDLSGIYAGFADAGDIDFLYDNFGNTTWRFDLDVDGWPTPSGADQQDVDVLVRIILETEYGDANLDGQVNSDDFNALASNFGGSGTWATGDFSGNGLINSDDFNLLASHFGFMAAGPQPTTSFLVNQWHAATGTYVPEPGTTTILMLIGLALSRRGRRVESKFHPDHHRRRYGVGAGGISRSCQ
jgi:glycosidase